MEDNKANRFRFRAWCVKLNEMIYCDKKPILAEISKSGLRIDVNFGFGGSYDCVVMQSTGLVDKNGKEIFEGDLLEYDGEIIEIKPPEWQVIDAFCVHCRPGLDSFRDDYSRQDEPSRMIRKGEIIGNIYENGDLLK